MSCEYAMITKVTTLTADQPVAEGMAILKKNNIRAAPVIDGDNRLIGIFSHKHLLTNMLPVSVTMDDGLDNLDFVIGAAPGIAKRLERLKSMTVGEVVDRKAVTLTPLTPIWEAIRLLVKHGSPLPVIDEKSGNFLGIITEQSAINQLELSATEKKR